MSVSLTAVTSSVGGDILGPATRTRASTNQNKGGSPIRGAPSRKQGTLRSLPRSMKVGKTLFSSAFGGLAVLNNGLVVGNSIIIIPTY